MTQLCESCGRRVSAHQLRARWVPATWGEPGHDEWGCVYCLPDADDLERAENNYWEDRISRQREGVEDVW